MTKTRLASSIVIRRPPDAVFDALIDASRFTTWKDGLAEVTEADPDLGREGARYAARLRMMGREVVGRYVITECDRPRKLVQIGESAGSRTVSANALTPTADGGTALDFSLEYEMPWGLVGELFDRLVFRRRIEHTLHISHERLRDLLES